LSGDGSWLKLLKALQAHFLYLKADAVLKPEFAALKVRFSLAMEKRVVQAMAGSKRYAHPAD
jgi:hypothetical protein